MALLRPEPVELWMRVLVSVLLVSFGVYAALLLDRAERIQRELRENNEQLEEMRRKLELLVVVDPLTGVFNRRKFHESLNIALSKANRHQHMFALLMIDIDHFKRINDQFGHQIGDRVLRIICDQIRSSIRNSDQMFRVGGEEFCLLAAETDAKQAKSLAEKIRLMIESHPLPEVGKLTVSIGISDFEDRDTQESIYARADMALYDAKHQGRNCVAIQ